MVKYSNVLPLCTFCINLGFSINGAMILKLRHNTYVHYLDIPPQPTATAAGASCCALITSQNTSSRYKTHVPFHNSHHNTCESCNYDPI